MEKYSLIGTGIKQLKGKMSNMKSYIEWVWETYCPNYLMNKKCKIYHTDKKNYYKLMGTEKQIIYATKIIDATKRRLHNYLPSMYEVRAIKLKLMCSQKLTNSESKKYAVYEKMMKLGLSDYNYFYEHVNSVFMKKINFVNEARYWIEKRNKTFFELYISLVSCSMAYHKANDTYQNIVSIPFKI